MGAWGVPLFSDDIACDVREGYRDLLGQGLSSSEASDKLMDEWADTLDDPDEAPVFWLSLAATQWRCGRLENRVKKKALAIIARGEDLRRWQDDPKLVRRRQAALEKVRLQLLSPQPLAKRIALAFKNACNWKVGEIICYRLLSQRLVLLRVIGLHKDRGGTSPIFEVLDWSGLEIPEAKSLKRLKVKKAIRGWQRWNAIQFMVGRRKEKELPAERVRQLGIRMPPSQKPRGYFVFLWRSLDKQLKDLFGIE